MSFLKVSPIGQVVVKIISKLINNTNTKSAIVDICSYTLFCDRFQDCNHEPTRIVLERYANAPDSGVSLILQPDLTDILVPPKEKKFRGYFNIARHYRFALNHTFYVLGYESVIIVEDDLDISSDFYEYFLGTYALLKNDPTLWYFYCTYVDIPIR